MSLKNEGLTLQQRTDRLLGRVAGGRYTPLAPKASTSEPPPKPVKEVKMAESKLDAEKISALLDIIEGTRDLPELKVIFDEALRELAEMAHELQEAIDAEKEEKAA